MELGWSATPSRLFACGSAERALERLGRDMSCCGGIAVDEAEDDREEPDFVDISLCSYSRVAHAER